MHGIGRKTLTVSAGLLAFAVLGSGALAQADPAPAVADPAIKPVVEKTCASCHVFTQVSAQRKSPDQWALTVDQMIGYGATVSDEDYPKFVDYLSKTYPAQSVGEKPAGH
jgi:hypothetical protein